MKTYVVYNGFDNRLYTDESVIVAKNGADAARQLLKQIGLNDFEVKRSADNDVRIKTTPIKIINGQKYLDGKVSWFRVFKREVKECEQSIS